MAPWPALLSLGHPRPPSRVVSVSGLAPYTGGGPVATAQRQPREEAPFLHLLFVGGALVLALAAGFSLGVTLAAARAAGSSLAERWPALVQAHGHVQVAGWAGLFVMGMAYRLAPRFAGATPVPTVPVLASFGATFAGLLIRTVGQPFLPAEAARLLLPLSAGLELIGGVIFAFVLLPRLRRSLLQGSAFAPYMTVMVLWLLLAKGLALAWLWRSTWGAVALVPFDRQQTLYDLELVGFVLSAVIGVSLRSVVIFFGRQPPRPRLVWSFWTLLQLGLAIYAVASVWESYRPVAGLGEAQAAGRLLMGLGLIVPALYSAFWRPPLRLRASARRPGTLVRLGMAWLAAGGLLMVALAGQSLARGGAVAYNQVDAVRHLLAVGTVTTMIIGMGYLVMPAFAMARQTGLLYHGSLTLALLALPTATALRVAGGWSLGHLAVADHLTAGAGILAWLAVAAFALSLARALRQARETGPPAPTASVPSG
jgi:uncharacterized protein involved in response to NO